MINIPRALLGRTMPQSEQHRAERFNRDMAKREAGNFYWGFISLGYHERMAIYALYNFARQVDDEADAVGARKSAGAARRCTANASRAACAATTATIRSCACSPRRSSATRFPSASCRCWSTASRWISHARATQTCDELRAYCNLVASVVGRMCVRIFGFERSGRARARRRSGPRAAADQHLARRARGRRRHGAHLPAARRSGAIRHSGSCACRAVRSVRAGTIWWRIT